MPTLAEPSGWRWREREKHIYEYIIFYIYMSIFVPIFLLLRMITPECICSINYIFIVCTSNST